MEPCTWSHLYCMILPILYVSSLYVWGRKQNSANPSIMKKRFISVITVTIISPYIVQLFVDESLLEKHTFWEILGLRWEGLITATILPLVLTMILFLGPMVMEYSSGIWMIYLEPEYWTKFGIGIMFLRNQVIAPITEEFVFRSCTLALLLHCVNPMRAIFICPLYFGAAHIHHIMEQLRLGVRWKVAVFTSCFQFMYTTVFGAYSAFLFVRTGHCIAPVLAHSFCNLMGFPNFGSLRDLPPKRRWICGTSFIAGLILWMVLLYPLTNPQLYSNTLPWSHSV